MFACVFCYFVYTKKLICHTVTVYSYVVSVIKLKVKIRIRDLPV